MPALISVINVASNWSLLLPVTGRYCYVQVTLRLFEAHRIISRRLCGYNRPTVVLVSC